MPEELGHTDHQNIKLRPVAPADEQFLYEVYASTRAREMELVPWSDAQREAFLKMQFYAQRDHYLSHFPDSLYQVILLNDLPVGRLYLDRRAQEIRILDIALLPEFRNRGIGTPLIKEIMKEAAEAGKAVSIYVDSFSPAAHLFERLGFSRLEDDGINILFEWRPAR